MLTGPPPKFHGTRDILRGAAHAVADQIAACKGATMVPQDDVDVVFSMMGRKS